VAYRQSSINSANSNAAPTTAVPAGTAANDIEILLGGFDQQTATYSGKWPASFIHLDESAITLDGQKAGISWKRPSGADTGSYAMTATPGSGVAADWALAACGFSGRDTGNPPVQSTVAVSNTNSLAPAANGVTAAAGDDLAWLCALDRSLGTSTTVFTPPSGYTLRQSVDLGFTTIAVATIDNVGAGATGSVAGSYTLSAGTSGWAAWLVRIPATAAAATSTPGPLIVPGLASIQASNF